MGIARRLEKTRIVQNRERDKMVMKRIIENRIFRNLSVSYTHLTLPTIA